MKRFMLCAQALILCLCVDAANAQFDWKWIYPPVQGETLTGIDVMFPTSAIAVGAGGAVILTTDRGMTWQIRPQVPGQPNLNAVSAITSSTMIVTGNGGLILRSTSAAQTWLSVPGGTTADLHAVDFHGLTDGFAVGTEGTILRSTDAGETWTPQVSGATTTLRSVCMLDAATAVVVGSGGVILKTTDGGANWVAQTSGTAADLFDVDFYGTNPGMVVGSGVVLITQDGGATWSPPATPFPIPVPFTARSVDVTSFPHAVIVGTFEAPGEYCPLIAHTADGGVTWSGGYELNTAELFGVAMFTESEGVAIGAAGAIRRTTDDGASWPQIGGGLQPFRMQAVDFLDPMRGRAISRDSNGWEQYSRSRVYSTGDGGATWSAGEPFPMYDLADVAFADANTVYVLAAHGLLWLEQNGAIWRSMDGGWMQIYEACCWPLCEQCTQLSAMDFAGPDVGLAVGDHGLVTINGFVATWIPSPVSTALHGVSVPTPHTAYAVGDDGAIIKGDPTSGAFAALVSGTTEVLRDVFFVDALTGWVVGENGTILSTSDGGEVWTPQASGTLHHLTSVSFIDAANGIVGTEGPMMLKTLDGGNTWVPEEMFFPIADIDFVSPVCAVAVGDYESIIMHRDGAVAVFFQDVSASVQARSVELRWDVYTDEAIQGFRVYRDEVPGGSARTSALLGPAQRAYVDRDVVPGSSYEYAVVAIGEAGNIIRSRPVRVSVPAVTATLHQNTPNPFNPATHIRFSLPERARVTLSVFDVAGRRVTTLVNSIQSDGDHDVIWDGRNAAGDPAPSGIYFYELRTPGAVITRKMLFLK